MENQHLQPVTALTFGLAGVLVFALMVLAFSVGMWVGQERAQFSYQWAENYHKNFGREFANPHGVFGSIINIEGNTLMVKGQDGIEKVILILPKTVLVSPMGNITVVNLNVGDVVVVIGSPNKKGQIEAKLIRLMPPVSFIKRNMIKL